jgi:[ribosomal protein S5]-alanine N-acetyltransferase
MAVMETERLILRRFLPEDGTALFEYLSDPDVVRFEPYGVYTRSECMAEAMERYEAGEDSPFWAVCLKDSGSLIGHLYFQNEEPRLLMTWQLGYVFNPAYHGQGYATEASRRILRYGFEEQGAHRVIAGADVRNTASWRVMERLSMRREAHMLQGTFFRRKPDGTPDWIDSYRYAILSGEWRLQMEVENC